MFLSNNPAKPPTTLDSLKAIVCSAAGNLWNAGVPFAANVQAQGGVDVLGTNDALEWIGLTCRDARNTLTRQVIQNEVRRAEAFYRELNHFYIATSAAPDIKMQRVALDLTNARVPLGRFTVTILAWPDIWNALCLNEHAVYQHYPQFRSTVNLAHDRTLFAEFQSKLDLGPVIKCLTPAALNEDVEPQAVLALQGFPLAWNTPEKHFHDREIQSAFDEIKRLAPLLFHSLRGMSTSIEQGSSASADTLKTRAYLFGRRYGEFVSLCQLKLGSQTDQK